ncbi:NADPH-dependent FMN reductase [Companilactobacillus sp. HBUAS56275]|uniref:NAD(P)H-dependent oxidoreductase n=1 Tax=Candidatus Companilactobacillus pullicola TaxID=2838523 RepID=A0A9D1ZNY5_9LACO|nr:NAD(P)H-dependent oxidoreductase [Candidatus Companilactobacillus pullicola]
MAINIGIILGTVRSNSLGKRIFDFLKNSESETEEYHFTWINLKDYPLPLYNHEETPLEGNLSGLNKVESKWLDIIKQQDGYIIMSPEYDHAIPGGLKNALDFIGPEVESKPVQIVTYSYYSDGGMLAASSLVPILQMLKMIVLPTPLLLWNANDNFSEDGQLLPVKNSDHFEARLNEIFEDIEFYSKVLKENSRLKRVPN